MLIVLVTITKTESNFSSPVLIFVKIIKTTVKYIHFEKAEIAKTKTKIISPISK